MMKRLLLSILVLLAVLAVRAARAYSEPFIVSQPDGSQLTLILNGDEHQSWLTTTDGTIVLETLQGYYIASIEEDGGLIPSHLVAHQPGQRSMEEQQVCLLQQQRQKLFFQKVESSWETARRAQVTNKGYFPHSGSPKCLVILVNFSDLSFSSETPLEQFEQYMNGELQEDMGHNESRNLVGVKRYFELSSQGKFTPQFDVIGPVTLPDSLGYYGKDMGNTKDVNFNQFCNDAIAAVDDQVDFRDYDNNNDGTAELVCVIYAGSGQSVSGNPANTLWPKCAYRGVETNDGVSVTYMNCSPELMWATSTDINGIGLFCHEFSHGMGLPDLYVTRDNARINNQSPEFFDVMDYGEYANSGYAPVPYTVWEQEAMGWIEVEQLTDSQAGIELTPLVKGGKAYKFGNGANDEEWMMIENVQMADKATHTTGFRYGHGLLVWHIAYAYNTVNMSDYPNNTPKVPRVCIVPADSILINGYQFGPGKPYTQAEYIASMQGSPFPGTCQVTTLTAEQMLPNYRFYNGEETPYFQLVNINEDESTGVVTFDFVNEKTVGIKAVTEYRDDTAADYYTLDGRCVGNDYRQLPKGFYVRNGLKVIKK